MEVGIVWTLQRKNVYGDAALFQSQNLVEDESFRKNWKLAQDITNSSLKAIGHVSPSGRQSLAIRLQICNKQLIDSCGFF